MTDDKDKREGQAATFAKNAKNAPGDPGKDPRQDRLKLALRENLKRRKSQARGRGGGAIAPSDGEDVSPHETSGKKPNG
jgi:hypothetical protein